MILRDLMRSSFRLIQEIAPGQTGHADDETDGMLVLNSMLDAWAADPLMPYATSRDVYPLAAGQASMTIGASGELDGARPVSIKFAALQSNDVGAGECELAPLEPEQYSRGMEGLYNDRLFPDSTLYIVPIPTSATNLVLYTSAPLPNFTSVTQAVKAPPAYIDAIRYNLAVRLGPEWNRVVRRDVAKLADDAMNSIKSVNAPAPTMQCNTAMLGARRWGWGFNIRTGRW